jgi:hypothetical protein
VQAKVTFHASDGCSAPVSDVAYFSIRDTLPPTIVEPPQELRIQENVKFAESTLDVDDDNVKFKLNSWLASHGGAVAIDAVSKMTLVWVG